MSKVKGSRHFRLKVVPHRPVRSALIITALIIAVILAVVASYLYAERRTAATLLSPEQAQAMRAEVAKLTEEALELRQQVAKYQLNSEVDRQAAEEMRQQAVARRIKIAALEREIAVYRMMSSSKNNNPQGISFGAFSVTPASGEGASVDGFHIKLAIQKLTESDSEFHGELQFVVVGQRDGKEERIPLYQLVQGKADAVPLVEKIPLEFKFFQNIEADVLLPEGFVPNRVDLSVNSAGKNNPLVIEGQLEWPLAK